MAGHRELRGAIAGAAKAHHAAAATTTAPRQAHLVHDAQVVGCRVDGDDGATTAWGHGDVGCVFVNEQGVGNDVVGFEASAVEVVRLGIGRGEEVGVDDDVAINLLDTAAAQFLHEAPPALDGQCGITATLQYEIAFQAPPDHGTGGPSARGPSVVRAQQA